MTVSHYVVERAIDKGTFSDVFLARNAVGNQVVIKKINKTKARRELVLKEVKAGRRLRFMDGIAVFHEHYEDDNSHFLVFDYVPGINLFSFMEQNDMTPFEEADARNIFRQLAKTVMHAHSRGVFHLDIKLENILVNDRFQTKLIDWGFCHFAQTLEDDTCSNYLGSIEYCSPEILQRRPYSGKSADTFSLGIILFTLLFAEFPWSAKERLQALHAKELPRLAIPPDEFVSSSARDLIKLMLRPADTRIALADVMQHEWLAGVAVTEQHSMEQAVVV